MRSTRLAAWAAGILVPALALPVPAAAQGATATADVLIKQLAGDKDVATRARAARDLGAMNGTQAIPALVAALRDPEAMVRSYSVDSLGRVGRGSEPVAAALAGALQDPDPGVRAGAAIALKEVGPPALAAVPALERALADKSFGVRLGAAHTLDALARAKASRVLAVLVATMKGANRDDRAGAAGHLMMHDLARADVREAVLDALAHGTLEVRKVVAEGLAEANMSAEVARPYVAVLTQAAKDTDEGVRRPAVQALDRAGATGQTQAVEQAVKGLGPGSSAEDVQRAMQRIQQAAAPAAGGPVDALVEALRRGATEQERVAAAKSLGGLSTQGDAAAAALAQALGAEPSRRVRVSIAAALGTLDDVKASESTAIRALVQTLKNDAEPSVVEEAARALGYRSRNTPEAALSALRAALSHPDEGVQQAAKEALRRLGQ